MKLDRKRLEVLIDQGLAIHDAGDGAWTWTSTGRETVSHNDRIVISAYLYHEPTQPWDLPKIARYFTE